jgi:sugar O-acyltransferase (sialic acid O-acetyltransferase NeuD family)
MKPAWVFGAGGHAKTVIDALLASRTWDVLGLLDDDRRRWGTRILGIPVEGDVSRESIRRFGIEHAIIAIGSNAIRARIAGEFGPWVSWISAIHPTAYLAPGVRLGAGCVIFAGAVVEPDTSIGDHVILNTLCSASHDSVIGSFAHIAPGARLAGGVTIGEGAFIGLGACILPGLTVGDWATVGAGGVVTSGIPDRAIAKGVPARF